MDSPDVFAFCAYGGADEDFVDAADLWWFMNYGVVTTF